MAAPKTVDFAKLEALNQAAEARFLRTYEGAILKVPTTVHNRPVVRFVKRSYMRCVLDWYQSTTLARAHLSDRDLPKKIEMAMLKKVGEVKQHFKNRTLQIQSIVEGAGLDQSTLAHSTLHSQELVLLGPVSAQVRSTLIECDRYLDLVTLAYTMGEVDEEQSNTALYEVKGKLEAMQTSLRAHRVQVLKKINESGKSRPGYKPGTSGAAEDAVVDAATDPTSALAIEDSGEPAQVNPVVAPEFSEAAAEAVA